MRCFVISLVREKKLRLHINREFYSQTIPFDFYENWLLGSHKMNVIESVGLNGDSDSMLVFENTYYSLFLYLLCDEYWQKRDFLIFGDRISFDMLTRLKKHANVLDESYRFMPRPMPKFQNNPFEYMTRKRQQKQLFAKYDACIGNVREINNWLIEIKRIQIEDGTLTRNELTFGGKKRGVFEAFFEYLFLKEPHKTDRINKFVIAAEVKPLPQFAGKVAIIDFFALWQNKSAQERVVILDVFDVELSQFSAITSEFSILFTQPWSESANFDYAESKKVNGYKRLIEELSIDESELVIKPHPREVTDYQHYFPEAIVLKASFPSELMPLLNVSVNKVVSLSSTAGSCFKGRSNEIIYARAPEYFDMPQKMKDSINRLDL
jgi:hypothetical protein